MAYPWKIRFLIIPLCSIFAALPSLASIIIGASAYEPSERSVLLNTIGLTSHSVAAAALERGDLSSAWSGYQKTIGLCGGPLLESWRPVIAKYSYDQLRLCASAYRNNGIVYLRANRSHHACISFSDSIGFGDDSLRPWVTSNCNPMPQAIRLPDWLTKYGF